MACACSTSVERATAMTDLSAKFESYGIEHEDVDANDLIAVITRRELMAAPLGAGALGPVPPSAAMRTGTSFDVACGERRAS